MVKPDWLVAVVSTGMLYVGCGEHQGGSAEGEVPASVEQDLSTLVTCPVGSVTVTFDPPLRRTPQDVVTTSTGVLSNCVTLLGSPVTSATAWRQLNEPGLSCANLLKTPSTTLSLTWNTGETSTLRSTQVRVASEPAVAIAEETGTVLSGKFEGATSVRTATFVSTDLAACDSPEGLSSLNGLLSLSLVQVL
ncbi:hypothetical protein [Myxococcus sp. AS-1-15]|uniref:hypothetical protein n=1 Tax=Myxococcus sp. AS-1-15 TaxID=2874600 RepID=UPI001CBD3C59|nr:hypothetical protein [Myxococcus sp. AS-1-15]MBZ4401159.1 hypothetical protein [Myxococcus sp. AS-1-15]